MNSAKGKLMKTAAALILPALLMTAQPYLASAQDIKAAAKASISLDKDTPRRKVGEKPVPSSLEEGLWHESEKVETKAKTSGERTRDLALEAYVQGLMDKVMKDHKGESRVYVMERHVFNASMAPNGYTEVWTGLLLRAQTEDEVAFVLGHEAGHFLHNHSISAYQAFKDGQNAALAASMLIAVVAMGAQANAGSYAQASDIGSIASGLIDVVYLGSIASYFSYSRDKESYADLYGHALSTAAGFDQGAGEALWADRLKETSASDYDKVRKSPTRINIFGSHPLETSRVEALQTYNKILGSYQTTINAEDRLAALQSYRAKIRPYLSRWLEDDLKRQDYGQTIHIIDQKLEAKQDLGLLYFYRGEALRLKAIKPSAATIRNAKEGTEKPVTIDFSAAIKAYETALTYPDAPPMAHKQVGELYRRTNEQQKALEALRTYLRLSPEAEDAWMVDDEVQKLTKALEAAPTPEANAPTAPEPVKP
jgi:predicted Zn-dependent protease